MILGIQRTAAPTTFRMEEPVVDDCGGATNPSAVAKQHPMTAESNSETAATASTPTTPAAPNHSSVERQAQMPHHPNYTNGFGMMDQQHHPYPSYPPHHHHLHHHHHPLMVSNAAGFVRGGMMVIQPAMNFDGSVPHHAAYSEGDITPPATASAADSTGNDDTSVADAEDPLKLFVGQVPKQMSEEEIFPIFDAFGPLKDVAIIRDKHTGSHRGCAFVTYWSSADAVKAQMALHDQFTFPGAKRPTQVKPAEPSVPENKLFIGMLSRTAGEEEVRELFQEYGEIREIHMIRSSDGTSRCAAFLRYTKREAAVQAIESLNNSIVMDGATRPLIVKFADNKHQRQQRHLRNIRKQEIMSMGAGMPPPPAAMYPPPPGAYQTAGPTGGPQMPMHPHPTGSTPGGSPYSQMPHPQYAHHPPLPHFPGAPHPYYFHPHHQQQPYMQQPPTYGPPSGPHGGEADTAGKGGSRPQEGPAGANLFVYHLPHDLTDADLATAFNSFGNVISAKVFVDKYTGESKGFGFVSYDSVIAAEAAIEQMNGFQIGNKRLKVQHKRVHGMNPNLPVHRVAPPSGMMEQQQHSPDTS